MRESLGRTPGLLISAIVYAALYLALRRISMDQWYLPAGLRFVALVVLPRRFWPILFISEACAIFSLTLPLSHQYGLTWSILSPLVTFPPVAAIIHLVRRRTSLARILSDLAAYWFAGAAGAAALVTTTVNKSLGALLMGGFYKFSLERSLVYLLGEYLGILMFAIPVALIVTLSHRFNRRLMLDLILAAPVFAMFALISSLSEHSGRVSPLSIIVIMPAIWLTFRHGWAGGALGSWVANWGVAAALSGGGVIAAIDHDLLWLQAVTAVFSTLLVTAGAKFSQDGAKVAESHARVEKAMSIARQGFGFSEDALRDLRASLGRQRTQHRAWSPRLVGDDPFTYSDSRPDLDAIYPVQIDDFGLFAALGAPVFSQALADAGIALKTRLIGDTRLLSSATKHAIYRLAHDAIRHLALSEPTAVQLTIKIRDGAAPRIDMAAVASAPLHAVANNGRINAIYARALAYGATVHARGHRVHISMWDVPEGNHAQAVACA